MADPFSLLCSSIAFTKDFIKAIDLITGASTNNTPTAATWETLLSELKMELVLTQDELNFINVQIEPMRVKQDTGADAARRKRKEISFDELLVELGKRLEASQEQFRNATDKFNKNGFFDWVLLESLHTQARVAIAPIQHHIQELKEIRLRVHRAQDVIIHAFLAACYNHGGDRFPKRLGGIRDQLAIQFIKPEPFFHKPDAKGSPDSGLLECNMSDATLKELHGRIQETGEHWVRAVRLETLNSESKTPITALDVLEKCQEIMLAQLDKGIFDAIINSGPLFTTNDRMGAIRGRCTVRDWRTILLGGGGGIMIALGGMMSAGKSSIINAMLGRPLLPTGERICTAVPCRLHHVSDKIDPTLAIPWMEPYEIALKWIKAAGLPQHYRDSKVPEKLKMWAKFQMHDPEGMDTLLEIETDKCPALMAQTSGQDVARQMNFLNSIVRICRAFENDIDLGDPYQWPILSVEFTGLRHYCQDLSTRFSLLDLPGFNDSTIGDTERFARLMTRAARQADLMVPVMAGNVITETNGWAKNMIRPEWSTKIASAIITKQDLVDNRANLQLPVVAKLCRITGRPDCILLCDTPKGMAAMQLHLRLDEIDREIDRKYAANPIPPGATAKTDPRFGQEFTDVMAELTNKIGSLYRLNEKQEDFENGRAGAEKEYEDFTMRDWRDLVEECLRTSQIRQTCDKFAETTIEEARRLRLSRFTGEMEPILEDLVSSLALKLAMGRASLSELVDMHSETDNVLSDLRSVTTKLAPCIDRLRTRQESKLHEILTYFVQVAKENANDAITSQLSLLTMDGEAYVFGKAKNAEALVERCHRAVLDSVNQRVEDTIRDLSQLWDENQAAVLSLLQDAMAKVAKRPALETVIASTIKELDKVRCLDPEKIRIAVSGTSGEAAVEAASKGMWDRLRSRSTPPVSSLAASEPANQIGWITRLFKVLPRFSAPQSTHSKHSANVSVTEGPPLPSGTSRECPDGSVASQLGNLAVAIQPASLAKNLQIDNSELQFSVPTTDGGIFSANTDSPSKGLGEIHQKGTVKLTREALDNRVLSTSFHPVISRVKTGAQLCMTESLNEMATLAHHTICGVLQECYQVTEQHMEAQKSKGAEKLQADTLECLICWGNLVAAQGAMQEMKRLIDKPVIRVMPSRPSSALLSSGSSFAGLLSARSPTPSPSSDSRMLSAT